MTPLDDLIQNLSDAPPARTRACGPWRMFAMWMGASALYIAFLLVFAGLRPDLMERLSAGMFVGELALLAAVIASTGLAAAVLSFPDNYQWPALCWLPILPVVAFMALLYASYVADSPPAPLPPHNMECLVCISLYALVPACALFYSLRKQAPVHLCAAGGVAVVNAFAIGCFALRLSEPTDSALHLIQWHYIPMLLSSVVGLVAGKLALKW